jgi:adenylate cyclase
MKPGAPGPRRAAGAGKRRPRRRRDALLAVLAGIAVGAGGMLLGRIGVVRTFELKTVDLRFRIAGSRPPRAPVAIVFIGDDSVRELGRWPWSWEYHAMLVDILGRAGARQVLFDIIFAESPGAAESNLLSGMAKLAGNVVLCSHFKVLEAGAGEGPLLRGVDLTEPVPELARAVAGVGHCNAQLDIDGNARRTPLVLRHGDRLYPAATLRAALNHLGASTDDVGLSPSGELEARLPDGAVRRIPVDRNGQTLVNFLGDEKTFPSYSFRQVLQADSFPEKAALNLGVFKDKIVLVGVTFAGSTDVRPSPFSVTNPMVCNLATVIENIITGDFVRELPEARAGVVLVLLGALTGLVSYALRPLPSFLILNAVLLAFGIAAQAAFSSWRLIVPVVTTLLTIGLTHVLVTVGRFVQEERGAREVRRMFSNYATERLVDLILEHPHLSRLGGERREVTVLFADIVGFTSLAESRPAEEVVSLLNEYLGEMTEIIFRWEGTLDKFVGDAIVAFWGAPLEQKNHGELALRCALNMIRRMEELRVRWAGEGRPELFIGIGLNTGEVIVGNVGAEGKKMDYTVIGDPVNLGARVESLTRTLHCHLLITEATFGHVRETVAAGGFGHLHVAARGEVAVKGKNTRVNVFQVDSLPEGADCKLEF